MCHPYSQDKFNYFGIKMLNRPILMLLKKGKPKLTNKKYHESGDTQTTATRSNFEDLVSSSSEDDHVEPTQPKTTGKRGPNKKYEAAEEFNLKEEAQKVSRNFSFIKNRRIFWI